MGTCLLDAKGTGAHRLAELLPVSSHQVAGFSLSEHAILARLSNECRKRWEVRVDL